MPHSGMLQYCSAGRAGGGDASAANGTAGAAAASRPLQWGSVCNAGFKVAAARAACRQLGYVDGFILTRPHNGSYGVDGLYYTFTANPPYMPVWLSDVQCGANARSLAGCSPQPPQPSVCGRNADVGTAASEGSVRLVGSAGASPPAGSVQVCIGRKWGTVCDSGWDDADASVACRQLGYAGGAAVMGSGRLANGSAPPPQWAAPGAFPRGPRDMKVLLEGLACGPADTRLDQCGGSGAGTGPGTGCAGHSRDAGAVCFNSTSSPPGPGP
ncbi:hypothetical protein GPECTOR_3g260 [Gonium pectorale]|uniref:SRCR domain-containing protein n=1 Tax=Gonium pectorale TaxID=33097 RepID=A0A150GYW7_GONPE|nr:hypothetical protein GPECTOR_3g260 [Gonium pectorale]|eukprot:KXZ55107.1 hypothetical protein GPECTOR_3g260 [Gonium pectorale]